MIIASELRWRGKYSYFHLFYSSVLSIQEDKTLDCILSCSFTVKILSIKVTNCILMCDVSGQVCVEASSRR